MRKVIILSLLAYAYVCCNSTEKTATEASSISKTDTIPPMSEFFPGFPAPVPEIRYPLEETFDKTINGEVLFRDEESILKNFGDIDTYETDSLEGVLIFNKNKSECLYLHQELGGGFLSYDKATITYTNKKCDAKVISKFASFETETGIKLGITEKEFRRNIYDKKIPKEEKGDTTIYSINYPYWLYSAEYIFIKGKLIEFSYGYDTP